METLAEKRRFEALTNIRGVADKWATTLGSLTGIFGIVALVKGPDNISKVQGSWMGVSFEAWVGIAIGIAVALALASVVCAAWAAQGYPRKLRFLGDEVRKQDQRDTRHAVDLVLWSRWLAVAAVVSMGIGIGITWYRTPDEPGPLSDVIAVNSSGIAACGTLQASTTKVVIQQKDKPTPTSLDPNEIVSLVAVPSCPGK